MDIKSAFSLLCQLKIYEADKIRFMVRRYGLNKNYILYVQRLAPDHWERIRTPKNSVRFYYQQMLTGYKIYN